MFSLFKKSSNYPFVYDDIDLRLRLPKKGLNKMRVLNVGAGSGLSGLARQLPYLPFGRLDFVDIHKPYLDIAKSRKYLAKEVNFIHEDVRKFSCQNYDIVLMFDVLEHLPKEDSLKVIDKIKCKQIIFIPLENVFRENTFGAKSQDHLSLWTKDDFDKLGYKTEELYCFHREGDEVFSALWALKN